MSETTERVTIYGYEYSIYQLDADRYAVNGMGGTFPTRDAAFEALQKHAEPTRHWRKQPPTEPRAGITYCVICNAPFTASDATAECEEHRTPTNPQAQTATPFELWIDEQGAVYYAGRLLFWPEGDEGKLIVQRVNQHTKLVAALRRVLVWFDSHSDLVDSAQDDGLRDEVSALLATTEQKGGELE